jgi:hypothetical protein
MAQKEMKEQIALVQWAEAQRLLLIHQANEGQRARSSGYILKLMGMRPGFPDLMFLEPSPHYPALFLEMKQNRKYTKSEMGKECWQRQQWWIDELNRKGYFATFCYGWLQGAKIITMYRAGTLKRD